MRKVIIWLAGIGLLAALLAAGAVLRTLVFTGQFSEINPHFSGSCRAIANVTGAEDLEIDPVTKTVFLSATDRRAVAAGATVNGALYRLDLSSPSAQPIPLWRGQGEGDFRPHGLSLYRSGDGKQRLFVINHPADGRHLVEVFDVVDGWLRHVESISDPLFISPNDLSAVGMRAFYIGNDVMSQSAIMKIVETMLPRAIATLIYFDGEKASVAASGISFVNGVAVSADGLALYLAEMMAKKLRVFVRNPITGSLTPDRSIALGSFPDNLSPDADGNIWIGAHPRMMDVIRHGSDPSLRAPAQVIRVNPEHQGAGAAQEIYLNAGEQISAVSAAAVLDGKMVLGPIFDSRILVCDLP